MSDRRELLVTATGFIGFTVVGFWDETIIANAEFHRTHSAITRHLESIRARLGSRPPESGSIERNAFEWYALLIHLSDGATIEIVAATLSASVV